MELCVYIFGGPRDEVGHRRVSSITITIGNGLLHFTLIGNRRAFLNSGSGIWGKFTRSSQRHGAESDGWCRSA